MTKLPRQDRSAIARGVAILQLSLLLPARVGAQASFTPLGDLPGGEFNSGLFGLNWDGSTAVGMGTPESGVRQAWRWTAQEGFVVLGSLIEGGQSEAFAVSDDGSVVIGRSQSAQGEFEAFRWTQASGMVGLGDLPGGVFKSSAVGISANGTVIAASAHPDETEEACRWTEDFGYLPIGRFLGCIGSTARGISGDGGVIVGASCTGVGTQMGFRWSESLGMQPLGDLPGGQFQSEAGAASFDGSVVVGTSSSEQGDQAFRWTSASGMVGLGDLPGGGFGSYAADVSEDGQLIVGGSNSSAFPFGEATIWDAAHGMRSIKQLLVSAGIDLNGWRLASAGSISGNGDVVGGLAFDPEGLPQGWIARIGALVGVDSATLGSDRFPILVWPQPARNSVNLALNLDRTEEVSLETFDVNGRRLNSIALGRLDSGPQHIIWTPTPRIRAQGILFMKLRTGRRSLTQKITLLE